MVFSKWSNTHSKHRLFEGGWSQPIGREMFRRQCTAALLPYDPVRIFTKLWSWSRSVLVLEHQNPWQYEIVARIIDTDESHKMSLVVKQWKKRGGRKSDHDPPITTYYLHLGCSERLDVFVGCVDATTAKVYTDWLRRWRYSRASDESLEAASVKMKLCWKWGHDVALQWKPDWRLPRITVRVDRLTLYQI